MLQMFLCATAKHCPLILHTFVEVFGWFGHKRWEFVAHSYFYIAWVF
jgi:hypothetical protein